MGGNPPTFTESPLSFSGIFFHERTKNYVLVNKVKNGPKWLYKRPKKAKNGVFDRGEREFPFPVIPKNGGL